MSVGPFKLDEYYQCDALEGLRALPTGSIQHITGSSPYNLSGIRKSHALGAGSANKSANSWKHRIDYKGGCDDSMDEEEYQQWLIDILNECQRVLQPGRACFLNHKIRHTLYKDHSPLEFIERSNMNVFNTIIWNRSTAVNVSPAFFIPSYEYIYFLTPERAPPFFNRAALPKQFHTSIWNIPIPHKPKHPASFPEQLPVNTIACTTEVGDTVLDPFAGSGTTLLAARRLGRHYLGFDISKVYQKMFYDELRDRMQHGEPDNVVVL